MNYLKNEAWFNPIDTVETYREVILTDYEVRQVIGKIKIKKIDQIDYKEKLQYKLLKLLKKKMD